MPTIQFSDGAGVLRGWNREEDFSVTTAAADIPAGSASTFTGAAVKDLTYSGRTFNATAAAFAIVVDNHATNPPLSFESNTPAVCTVNAATGALGYVGDGLCSVNVTGQTGTRIASGSVSTGGAVLTVYDEVTATAPGSLRAYLTAQQAAALVGVTPGAAAQRSNNSGVLNAGNFLFDAKTGFDGFPTDALGALLYSDDVSSKWKAWISPHHYLTWIQHGATDGANHRAIQGEIVVVYSATAWTGSLCKLLPSDFALYLPNSLVSLEYALDLWIRLYHTHDGTETRWVQPLSPQAPYPSGDARLAFQKPYNGELFGIGGDSGSPAFFGIGGDLVLYSHAVSYGLPSGIKYAQYITEINAAMAELDASGVYTVQTVDLGPSGGNFTIYP